MVHQLTFIIVPTKSLHAVRSDIDTTLAAATRADASAKVKNASNKQHSDSLQEVLPRRPRVVLFDELSSQCIQQQMLQVGLHPTFITKPPNPQP
jgi:Na+-translocating ferredoxin:NAD+ oxidoreductase RnfG subunit